MSQVSEITKKAKIVETPYDEKEAANQIKDCRLDFETC